MRLDIGGISQHWLCLKSPSFLSSLAVGLGTAYTCTGSTIICLLSRVLWVVETHTLWFTLLLMEQWLRHGAVTQEWFLQSFREGFAFTGGQLLMNFPMSVLCFVLPSTRRGDHRQTHHEGMAATEVMVQKAMFCTVSLHKSPLQRSVRVCLRNVCTSTIKACGYLRTVFPPSWILVWILFTVRFPLSCFIWQQMYIYINKNLTTLNNWTTNFEYMFQNTQTLPHK